MIDFAVVGSVIVFLCVFDFRDFGGSLLWFAISVVSDAVGLV